MWRGLHEKSYQVMVEFKEKPNLISFPNMVFSIACERFYVFAHCYFPSLLHRQTCWDNRVAQVQVCASIHKHV